uniref:Actin n=1 Tax=Panagrolaimus sp. JU765 TaxID=591449 RepID=A0AC34RCS4_9BILA
MFEKFDLPRFFLANRSVLGIASNKEKTGIVLNCGKTITTVVPIYMGHAIQPAIMSLKFGGQDLTNFLVEMLNNREYSLTTPKELHDVNTFKEKQCYVAMDF